MTRYKSFARVLVWGALIDSVTCLDLTGTIHLPGESEIAVKHAGAHSVAFVSTSLSRDYSLTSTSKTLEAESVVAVARMLANDGQLAAGGNADFDCGDCRFTCTAGAEGSSIIRLHIPVPASSSITFQQKDESSQSGTFLCGDERVSLMAELGVVPGKGTALALEGREKLRVISGQAPSLGTLSQIFDVGVREGVFYHTLEVSSDSQTLTLLRKESQNEVLVSVEPDAIFSASL